MTRTRIDTGPRERRSPLLHLALIGFAAGLVVAGTYIVQFRTIDLAGVTGGPIASVILLVERASAGVTNLIGERPTLWGAVFITVIVLLRVSATELFPA